MDKKIKQTVRETMKEYGVSDRKLERELVSACLDEYEMQISGGADEQTAFAFAVANIDEIAKSKIAPRNKYAFAFGMGIFAMCLAILEMLASVLSANISFYSVELPVAAFGILVILVIYLFLKRHSYRWYDFVILGAMLVSWMAAVLLLMPVFLYSYSPGTTRSLEFVFPLLFRYTVNRGWMDPMYDPETFTMIFYPNFIAALGIFVPTLVLFVRQHLKIRKNILSANEE